MWPASLAWKPPTAPPWLGAFCAMVPRMIASEAREWVELVTGQAGALVVLLGVVGVMGYWFDKSLDAGLQGQQEIQAAQRQQIEIMLQGQALMAENQRVLTEQLELQREQYSALRRLLFQNVDTPEAP